MPNLAITAAQVKLISGNFETKQVGEAVTAGTVLYLKAADSKAWKAISTSAAAALAIGIALGDAGADQYVVVANEQAIVDLGAAAAAAAGEVFSVSDTAGLLQPDADVAAAEFVTRVCEGIGSNQVKILIRATGIAHA